jgi:hypothetical protein
LLVSLVLLLALLVGHIAWTVRRMFSAGARAAANEEEKRARLSRTYWEEAQRQAAQGEYTEAIRYLFLSLVYRFDERGRVSFQKAYTNREYLTLFADRPPVHADLKVFVDTLDDYWYGQRPTGSQQYEACRALYDHLK